MGWATDFLFYSLNLITSECTIANFKTLLEGDGPTTGKHRIAGLTQARLREPALQEAPRTEKGLILAETTGSPSCLMPPSPGEKDEG